MDNARIKKCDHGTLCDVAIKKHVKQDQITHAMAEFFSIAENRVISLPEYWNLPVEQLSEHIGMDVSYDNQGFRTYLDCYSHYPLDEDGKLLEMLGSFFAKKFRSIVAVGDYYNKIPDEPFIFVLFFSDGRSVRNVFADLADADYFSFSVKSVLREIDMASLTDREKRALAIVATCKYWGKYSMPAIIPLDDIFDNAHIPAVIVIGAIAGSFFPDVLSLAANKIGFGNEFGVCSFQGDLDPRDAPLPPDSVECRLNDKKTSLLTFGTYNYYLEKYASGYLKDYPEQKEKITELLRQVRQGLCLGEYYSG